MDGVGIAEEEYNKDNEYNTKEPDETAPARIPVHGIEFRIHRMLDPENNNSKHYCRYNQLAGHCKMNDSYVCRYQRERGFEQTSGPEERSEVDWSEMLQRVIDETNKIEHKPNSSLVCGIIFHTLSVLF